jgi:CRISPR locus-related DNA-binding protein
LTSEKFRSVGNELAEELTKFGYTVEVNLIDAFDLRDVVDTVVSVARENPDQEIYVNITGGTNLMAGAATASAFFIGATPYYVLEPQTGEESVDDLVMKLPSPTQPLTFEIEGLQLDVLQTLGRWDEEGRKGVILREIGEELGESSQKISYHVNQLQEKGLIESEIEGRTKHVYVTDVGRLYLRWTN